MNLKKIKVENIGTKICDCSKLVKHRPTREIKTKRNIGLQEKKPKDDQQ